MILFLRPDVSVQVPRWHGVLAGLPAACDQGVRALGPFAAREPNAANAFGSDVLEYGSDVPARAGTDHLRRLQSISDSGALVFDARGYVAGAERSVRATFDAGGWLLRVAGIGALAVLRDGSALGWMSALRGDSPPCFDDVVHAMLGPPLVLALAARGRWCLHASAVMVDGGVVALVGQSGAGKSTLAAWMDERGLAERVADDILPISLATDASSGSGSDSGSGPSRRDRARGSEPATETSAAPLPPIDVLGASEAEAERVAPDADARAGVLAWPAVPQLKLPPAQQTGRRGSLPLRAIVLLDTDAATQETPRRLSASDAALAILRHTVGARLFNGERGAAHLADAARAASHVPVWRASAPHRWSALPTTAGTVIRLGRAGGSIAPQHNLRRTT